MTADRSWIEYDAPDGRVRVHVPGHIHDGKEGVPVTWQCHYVKGLHWDTVRVHFPVGVAGFYDWFGSTELEWL